MERQPPQLFRYSEDSIVLDAAIADLCHGGQASADGQRLAGNLGNQALGYSCDIVCCGIAHHSHCADVLTFLEK